MGMGSPRGCRRTSHRWHRALVPGSTWARNSLPCASDVRKGAQSGVLLSVVVGVDPSLMVRQPIGNVGPPSGRHPISGQCWASQWETSHRWAMLGLPVGDIPSMGTADPLSGRHPINGHCWASQRETSQPNTGVPQHVPRPTWVSQCCCVVSLGASLCFPPHADACNHTSCSGTRSRCSVLQMLHMFKNAT